MFVLPTVSGCRRDEASWRPGEVIPLDPGALQRRLQSHDGAVQRPLRSVRYVFAPAVPTADMGALARALEARAAAFDAIDPTARIEADRIVLTFLLLPSAWQSMVSDQLVRRGVLELYLLDLACDPWTKSVLPDGIERRVEWWDSGAATFYLRARPDHGRGIAPLGPLQSVVSAYPPPSGRKVLIGPVRDRSGDVARRTYCVLLDGALRAPRVLSVEPTLHVRTLDPVLYIQLGPPDDARLEALIRRAMGRPLVVAIDGEVIVAVRSDGALRDGRLEVVPQARVGSISPEVVAALLRSGPLPTDVRLLAP